VTQLLKGEKKKDLRHKQLQKRCENNPERGWWWREEGGGEEAKKERNRGTRSNSEVRRMDTSQKKNRNQASMTVTFVRKKKA